jgi:hypothetical protein
LYDSAIDGVPGIYATNKGPIDGDFAVTDGTHVLQVSNRYPANINFQFNFALPFTGTKLAEVLAASHSPADLAHYTLRWDTTMPAVWHPLATATISTWSSAPARAISRWPRAGGRVSVKMGCSGLPTP